MTRGAQAIEIVMRGTCNIYEFLALPAPFCEVEGVGPKCRPIVAGTHHFGCKGASSSIETVDHFMKFSYDIICLLVVQAFEQGCCQPSFE